MNCVVVLSCRLLDEPCVDVCTGLEARGTGDVLSGVIAHGRVWCRMAADVVVVLLLLLLLLLCSNKRDGEYLLYPLAILLLRVMRCV